MKRLLAACAFTAMLAGCGTAPGNLDARSDWSDGAAMQALLEGTLELRDGCLVVTPAWESEPPDTFVVPVFPRKYASWDDAREVLTFGGVEYEMGDEIAAGGGWGPPSDDIDLPAACEPDASGDVMYVQDTSLAPMNERGY
jgi:hypothetical protein